MLDEVREKIGWIKRSPKSLRLEMLKITFEGKLFPKDFLHILAELIPLECGEQFKVNISDCGNKIMITIEEKSY